MINTWDLISFGSTHDNDKHVEYFIEFFVSNNAISLALSQECKDFYFGMSINGHEHSHMHSVGKVYKNNG